MKKYNLADHKDEIITDLLKKLLWIPIAAIIPLVGKLISIFYTNIKDNTQYVTFFNVLLIICIILTLVSITLSIFIIRKNTRQVSNDDINSSSKNELSSDYRFSSIIAELTFDDNRIKVMSTIDYKMTVLSESVSELKRDLIWSGSKYVGTKIVRKNDDRYEIEDSTRNHSPYSYIIKYNTEKKRGDSISLKTETTALDENLDMIPNYSFMAKYQIDKLILRVIAPKGMIRNVKQAVYADRAKEICVEQPQKILEEQVRDLVRYTYEIDAPTLLYNYFIEWEFTKK